jgi:SAM-dependent methyltransferase
VTHDDHVGLLRDGVSGPGGSWADLGSGTGAFTLVLADLLGPGGDVHSVDRDERALAHQAEAMRARFPAARIRYQVGDFGAPLELPPLDALVMANSLHFCRDRETIVRRVAGYLRPGGRLLLVEYDTHDGNTWVPYPLSYRTWEQLARRSGLEGTRVLATRPSRFLGRIYAALSERPATPTPPRGPDPLCWLLSSSALVGHPAETTGEDNLTTMPLVHSAYDSAARSQVIALG